MAVYSVLSQSAQLVSLPCLGHSSSLNLERTGELKVEVALDVTCKL